MYPLEIKFFVWRTSSRDLSVWQTTYAQGLVSDRVARSRNICRSTPRHKVSPQKRRLMFVNVTPLLLSLGTTLLSCVFYGGRREEYIPLMDETVQKNISLFLFHFLTKRLLALPVNFSYKENRVTYVNLLTGTLNSSLPNLLFTRKWITYQILWHMGLTDLLYPTPCDSPLRRHLPLYLGTRRWRPLNRSRDWSVTTQTWRKTFREVRIGTTFLYRTQ